MVARCFSPPSNPPDRDWNSAYPKRAQVGVALVNLLMHVPRLSRLLLMFLSGSAVAFSATPPPQPNRWSLAGDGGIEWKPKVGDVHEDNIEMSGLRVSV